MTGDKIPIMQTIALSVPFAALAAFAAWKLLSSKD